MENILDADTALIASGASIDIDNILSHKSEDLTAMRRLAELLKNSVKIGQSRRRIDPIIINIFHETMKNTMENSKPLTTVTELVSEVRKIAKILSYKNPLNNPAKLRQAGDFCVALSNAVIGYRREMYNLRHQI
ncbi:MAG: hypothetical protein AAB696_01110 [Patescibacteria group bacterium]